MAEPATALAMSAPAARLRVGCSSSRACARAVLLGEKLILQRDTTIDPTLDEFAWQANLAQADLDMLASIQWRGEKPKT